jgi:hypothetical protein
MASQLPQVAVADQAVAALIAGRLHRRRRRQHGVNQACDAALLQQVDGEVPGMVTDSTLELG